MEPAQHPTLTLLTERFGDNILSADIRYGILTISVTQPAIVEILRFLFDHAQLQYRYLTTLCGIHHPEVTEIAAVSPLHSLEYNSRERPKEWLAGQHAETPAVTEL